MFETLSAVAFVAMLVSYSCTAYSCRSAAVTTLAWFVYEVFLAQTYDGSGAQIRVDLLLVLPLIVAAWVGAVATFVFGRPPLRQNGTAEDAELRPPPDAGATGAVVRII